MISFMLVELDNPIVIQELIELIPRARAHFRLGTEVLK